jgi:hypothetical protein
MPGGSPPILPTNGTRCFKMSKHPQVAAHPHHGFHTVFRDLHFVLKVTAHHMLAFDRTQNICQVAADLSLMQAEHTVSTDQHQSTAYLSSQTVCQVSADPPLI